MLQYFVQKIKAIHNATSRPYVMFFNYMIAHIISKLLTKWPNNATSVNILIVHSYASLIV